MRSASSFTFEPLFIVLGIAALVAYARAWRREQAGVWHAVAFGAGIVLIVAALNSPLETIAIDYLVLFHLLQNVIIADWAPPLLILGLSPLTDQKIAGVVMMVEQVATVGLAFVLLLLASRREQRVRLEGPATHQPVV